MDIPTTKQRLELRKAEFLQLADDIQIALDAFDAKVAVTFPNLAVVIAEKEQAVIEKEKAIQDKTVAETALADVVGNNDTEVIE